MRQVYENTSSDLLVLVPFGGIQYFRKHNFDLFGPPNSTELAWIGLYRLSYLAGGFFGLSTSISNKIHPEPLMHALSSCEGLVESNFNFIQSPLGVLWQTGMKFEMSWDQTFLNKPYPETVFTIKCNRFEGQRDIQDFCFTASRNFNIRKLLLYELYKYFFLRITLEILL